MLAEDVRKIECENERLRDENEELRRVLGSNPPKPMDCACCEHFIQHYIKSGVKYFPTCDGHCVHGRITQKKPEGKTCRYFKQGKRNFY